MNFKPTRAQFNSKLINRKVESAYWATFKSVKTYNEGANITTISFMEGDPHHFAATTSNRIEVFSDTMKIRTIAKLRETACSVSMRADGRLILAGDHGGELSLFDAKNRLRTFKGHVGPVGCCGFSGQSGTDQTVISASDDRSVRIWDVGTGQARRVYSDTSLDHIRAMVVRSDLILAGAHDGFGRIYDPRTAENHPIVCVETKWPIFAVVWVGSRHFVTGGTGGILVWDSLNPRTHLARLEGHHKAVTCLVEAGDFFLSGSLDRHVKVWSSSSFDCQHVFSYSEPVLSLGCSRGVLACGMVGGSLAVRSRPAVAKVPPSASPSLRSFDRMLKRFRHSTALDEALHHSHRTGNPEETVAVIEQLIGRNRLATSISGRSEQRLAPLLKFIVKNFHDRRFTSALMAVTEALLDTYSFDSFSPKFRAKLSSLGRMICAEIACVETMMVAQGSLEALRLFKD